MTDVSVYVAVISASAAILGASISPVSTAFQNSRQASRDRLERHETAARAACMGLMQAAVDLRTEVENNHEYHGDEMGARLAQVRRYAADARTHAFAIALLLPGVLGVPARNLAAAAGRLAVKVTNDVDLAMGVSVRAPDFNELDECIAVFAERAEEYASG
jgi:hypothetical protein